MTRMSRFRLVPGRLAMTLCLLGLTVGGCATKPSSPLAQGAGAAEDDGWGLEHTRAAIALLNAGQPEKARVRLLRALEAQPGDMIAQSLLKQVDTDPNELLGTESYAYKVKQGDTMSGLAQRFLGDPLMGYALARYNGLSSPTALEAGQSIRIPGKPKPPASAKKKSEPASAKRPSKSATPAPAPPPSKPATNPAQARKLRGQGLAAMNSGAIDRAVALLRQALAHDPGNALIKGDLARALRIQGTLKARP